MTEPASTPLEEAERAFTKVLQELRVVQTGVQILSAFLLTLPFTPRFATVSAFEKVVYVVTLVAAVVTMALVIAPVSYDRQKISHQDMPDVVRTATLLAKAGLATLSVSIVASVLLALELAVGVTVASVIAVVLAIVFGMLWYVLPVRRRSRGKGGKKA